MISDQRVVALIREKIRERNKSLAPYEAVRNFRIVGRDFTVEGEELTPTLKLRRQVVMARYRDLIDEMCHKQTTSEQGGVKP
jgi:long-chain acyl-CoA synthetase